MSTSTVEAECLYPERQPLSSYSDGCRCERCRTAAREYQRAYKARLAAVAADGPCMFPDRPAVTSYVYGCRCERCRVATREYQRVRSAKRLAEQRRFLAPRPYGPPVPYVSTKGYLYITASRHPLAAISGGVAVHRLVAHTEWVLNGCPALVCTMCAVELRDWKRAHVHHIDHDKTNNTPANLAVTCPSCNSRESHEWRASRQA